MKALLKLTRGFVDWVIIGLSGVILLVVCLMLLFVDPVDLDF